MASTMGSKSLQELSTEKALQQLLSDEHAEQHFESLESVQQRSLVTLLLKEHKRLKDVERRWDRLKQVAPVVDFEVFEDRLGRIRYDETDDDDADEEVGKEDQDVPVVVRANGYDIQERFQAKWRYISDASTGPLLDLGSDIVVWDSVHLEKESDGSISSCGPRPPPPHDMEPYIPNWCVSHAISSQLMLYRLVITFGGFNRQVRDNYQSVWEYDLKFTKDELLGVLSIFEYKGSLSVRFDGVKEASESALELLTWLISTNVPHSYNGTVAGTQA